MGFIVTGVKLMLLFFKVVANVLFSIHSMHIIHTSYDVFFVCINRGLMMRTTLNIDDGLLSETEVF